MLHLLRNVSRLQNIAGKQAEDKTCYALKALKISWVEKEEPKAVAREFDAEGTWGFSGEQTNMYNLYKTGYNIRNAAACNQHNKAGLGIQSYTTKNPL